MIEVRARERAGEPADVDAALRAIEGGPGVWLGCDVDVPGLYRREASAALDPLLVVYLDGARLRLLPHGPLGRALLAALAPALAQTAGAAFETVDGRLEIDTGPTQPVLPLLRRVLSSFAAPPAGFGFHGLLAFDYWRLQDPAGVPDDGRRRAVLMLPRRVLRTAADAPPRWVEFEFPGLAAAADATVATDAAPPSATLDRRADDHAPGGHAAAVSRGVERLRRGELCSLVLSQTFRRPVGDIDAAAAFARLRRDNPYPAMFFANAGGGERVFGASPDVQVRADARWVETAPVCGTFRRGVDALDDHAQGKALMNSAVDEASLAVCADSDRNDKATVCEPGSVEQLERRRLHFFPTLIHTIDHTRGRRRAGVDGFDIVLAHATPATVTGMPKAAARKAIADIEPAWRGWYAGAAVHIAADGDCMALTMLRFARLVDGWAEVRCGGSLLADSDPVREEQETQLKSETLFRVLAGGSPRPPAARAEAPGAPRCVRFVDPGDPLAPLAREALLQAGARIVDDDGDAGVEPASLQVIGDATRGAAAAHASSPARPDLPTLAINCSGLALLQADGAAAVPLDPPQFGRTLTARAVAGSPLAAEWPIGCDGDANGDGGGFEVGVYATHAIAAGALPAGWQLLAEGSDGRVVAALNATRRVAVLLCRPDSVLSQRRGAGRRLLRSLFDALDPRPTPATVPRAAGGPRLSTTEKETSK